MSILDATFFRDEEAAYAKLESILWPHGPECPHCGVMNEAHKITANPGKKVRYGLYRCKACKKQFTVTVGTVFERSHIPLHKWLQAAYLLNSSKKGISAKQIERILQVTYKSAWFMMHRLRAAMDPMYTAPSAPIGGEGKVVEADETYIGQKESVPQKKRSFHHMNTILSLVERGGEVRSFHIDKADKEMSSSAWSTKTCARKRASIRTAQLGIRTTPWRWGAATTGLTMVVPNTSVAMSTPTRLKASFRSSNGA